MKSMSVVALFALLLLGAACSHSGNANSLRDVWEHPLANDGRRFDMVVYPYDLFGDPDRYIMCIGPCPSARQANDEPVVIFPLASGEFDGLRGASPRRVSVIFRAGCFGPNGACPHRPFQFEQVE